MSNQAMPRTRNACSSSPALGCVGFPQPRSSSAVAAATRAEGRSIFLLHDAGQHINGSFGVTSRQRPDLCWCFRYLCPLRCLLVFMPL